MNQQMKELAEQANIKYDAPNDVYYNDSYDGIRRVWLEKFAELILANADELKRMMNTDPINKPFELNPKFVAKCDEIGRSRRQFQ